MRLYEFTNPTKYLPEHDTADLAKQNNQIKTADADDDAVRRLKKKSEIKKPTML
jgi:hypothetical protein